MKYWKPKLTKAELKFLRRLHALVIHRRKGTTKQYFLETKKIDELAHGVECKVCTKCFGSWQK